MKLITPYLGEIEYDKDEVIEFEQGLYGFEEKQRFILVNLEDPEFPFNWLQSIEDENLSFVLTSPFLFIENYEFDLSDTVAEVLGIEKPEDVLVLSTVVLNEELHKSTMNLQAPIIINRTSNKGRQIILEEDYELKYNFLQKKKVIKMLVLTRKDDESIIIGKNIQIKVIKSDNGKVKLGIDAPKDIEVNRKEIYDQIQKENRESVNKVTNYNRIKDIYMDNKNK